MKQNRQLQPSIFPLLILIAFGMNLSCVNQNRQEQGPWLRQIQGQDRILALIYEQDGKQGLLDTSGQVLLEAQFDYIQDWQTDGLVLVDSGGSPINGGDYTGYRFSKYGIITASGKVLFRPQFDDARVQNRAVAVQKDSLWGYVDDKGNWLIRPIYKQASLFHKGTAIVMDRGKFHLINKQNERINPVPFDSAWGFMNDITVVQKDGKWGYLHCSGAWVLPLDDYSGIGDFNWHHGMFRKDGQWFVIDTAGRTVIDSGFDQVSIVDENEKIYAKGIRNGKEIKVELK